MQKISNLKARLGANACLSTKETYAVKGGNNPNANANDNAFKEEEKEKKMSGNATEDDKRRERPGGLTSQ